jgi:alpha-glucosidase
MRWYALGIFSPLMRNHSEMGTRRQEVYRFTDLEGFKHMIGLRYKLLPYLYSEYMKAALRGDLMFRPLAFDHPDDKRCRTIEDQLYLGRELMIAPVYEQNARGRYVYLPERMKMLRCTRDGRIEETILEKGDHYVEVPLSDVVFFLREGHLLPLSKGGQCVDDVDFEELAVISFGEDAEYEYYHDDGFTRDYENPANFRVIRAGQK